MANIEKLIPHILKWEGGFVNDPYDNGGATNKGVTIKTFQNFYGKDKTIEDLKKITNEEWLNIFKSMYWDKCQADNINSQSIANLLVDFAYNSGNSRAIKYIQQLINVVIDGCMGPKTIKAINDSNSVELFYELWDMRQNYYYEIVNNNPTQAKFINGWLNRLDDIVFCDYE